MRSALQTVHNEWLDREETGRVKHRIEAILHAATKRAVAESCSNRDFVAGFAAGIEHVLVAEFKMLLEVRNE